jgi:hypothetical protein
MTVWTQAEAIDMCRAIESVIPAHGYHIALTGGLLYKHGMRKDADILFYHICAVEGDWEKMWGALKLIGLEKLKGEEGMRCVKASYWGKPVDCFFVPDGDDGTYGMDADDKLLAELFS